MGSALFIVPEREIPTLDVFVDGKALARSNDLDRLAEQAGVRPLMQFFSLSPEDAAEAFEAVGAELPAEGFSPPDWYSAEDGLITVRGLLAVITTHPERLPDASTVVEDLREFERVLSQLASEDVRWYLAVDC
jgi:hypothetical protein